MGAAQNYAVSGLRRFWRRLVGAAAIYALVAQPLLLAIGGTEPVNASAVDDLTWSQPCLHTTDGSPVAPLDQTKYPAHNRCLLCFDGAFHLLDAPQPAAVQPDGREFDRVRQSAHPLRLASIGRYSIARPRGPPHSA